MYSSVYLIFFCKQKTAYEMRISDWSSDVCSSDLALADLYAPMMNRLAESSGTLKKLSFNVIRVVDVSRWATDGEVKLIDCRKAGQFNGRGSLERVARDRKSTRLNSSH